LPRWSWQTVWLSWRGPVERDQRLHLMLASPRVNRVLAVLRVALTGLLLACVAGGALRSGGALRLPASAAGALVLVLAVLGAAGTHQVLLEGPLPDVDRVEMPLPLKPRRVEAHAEGWTVEGLREDGLAADNLEIVRVGERTESTSDGLRPVPLPPFVLVERSLSLGLSPQANTRVVRVTPPGSAIVIEVPLIPGESVATPDVRVQGGKALVSMGPEVS